MSRIWLLPDTHFGHQKLIQDSLRPYGFNDRILNNARRNTKEGDILIHLGDVCIGSEASWNTMFCNMVHAVDAKCWLTTGNHDKKSVSWYMNQGWDFAGDAIRLNMFGYRIMLSHRPLKWVGQYDINIHGHMHGNDHRVSECVDAIGSKQISLALENNNYSMFSLQAIVEKYTAAHPTSTEITNPPAATRECKTCLMPHINMKLRAPRCAMCNEENGRFMWIDHLSLLNSETIGQAALFAADFIEKKKRMVPT